MSVLKGGIKMFLYKFYLNTWRTVEIKKEILIVEEKPKTYMTTNECWRTRILKSDIGVLSGYSDSTLYLLEDDMEKAKKIFAESLKYKIEREKLKIKATIESCNECIAKYENAISILENN